MYLGIDVGTSVTKAAAFDPDGVVLAVCSVRTRLESPAAGWFEQDPDEVLHSVGEVARAVVAAVGRPPELIALTGQGDGVWLVDGYARPVRPAISWMDARATAILHDWLARDVVHRVFRHTGNALFPGAAAPVLAWLATHEPRSLDRAATAAYCKDVVMQRLTGVRATDASDASLPFLDPYRRCYHPDVLAWCGLADRAHLLPPVIDPLPTGQLTREAADLLGVPPGVQVTAGPFDLPAGAVGSGVDRTGEGHLILGTTLVCQVLVDTVDTSGEPAGMTLHAADPGRWWRAMPAMAGCVAIDWVMGLIGKAVEELDGLLAASPPGARGVSCLPYFSPAGERAPFLEPRARAGFNGLTVQTSRADLVRAACEAVAYVARHCFEAAGLAGEVVACGGGTGSLGWLRVVADVLGRPVRLAQQPETGARGAVLAGLRALGRDVDESAWTTPMQVIEPDPDRTEIHAEGYVRYQARVAAARAEWGEARAVG